METNLIDKPKADSVALLPQDKPVKRRCRRITIEDANWIADQVSRGLSESHAVSLLNKFTVSQWFNWKSKGKRAGKIADILTRTISGRMSNLVSEIETAATGGTDKAGRPVRHDWRAAVMLASLHDERFRSQQRDAGNTTNQTAIIIGAGGEQAVLKMLDGIFAQRQSLPCTPATKLIDCPANGQNDG